MLETRRGGKARGRTGGATGGRTMVMAAIAGALAAGAGDEARAGAGAGAPEEELYAARPLTPEGSFTPGIEGPACDAEGNVYAVNYERQQTIGRVSPGGKAEVFVTLPGKSTGNGLRFGRDGTLYVADYVGHNVLKVDPRTRAVSVHAHEERMSQPNDLALAPDGSLYASDPNWQGGTGRLWRIAPDGSTRLLSTGMGTTNGIDLSPDGKTLYVNESVQRKIWAFPVKPDGSLGEKRLLIEFPDHGFDGMRCDVDGNLHATRYGKGVVAVVSPEGKVLREVGVLGARPSNICFGGPDGRTAYVTEVEHQRIVQYRVERPGLEWLRSRERPSALESDPVGWEDLMPRPGFEGWRRVVLPSDPPSPRNPWSLSAGGKTLVAKGEGIKEMLLHEKERGDGVFYVEWRFTGGPKDEYNGGVYVRTLLDGKIWHQAQVAQMPKRPVLGDLFTDVPDPADPSKPKRVEVLSAVPNRARPPGEWNAMEVTCRGRTITVWVNGAATVQWSDCPIDRGHVGLQAEFYDLEFRSLRFKALDGPR
ncbi:MAG: SMP-30/gluconolactonase/LRE family protein [Planctomycetes bacterium]|nr:SMP-30/gluconolactonase/LRE family protein [Planctomycetota bacterium]